jgi:hypothetical protein
MIAKIRVTAFILIMAGLAYAQDYETLGRNLALDLFEGHFEKVASQFDEPWAKVMPASKLPDFLNMLLNLGGKLQTITGIRSVESKGTHTVYVACRFEKRTLHLIVSFDSRSRVTALNVSPNDPLQPPFDEMADAKAAIKTAVDKAALDDIRVLVTWGANDNNASKRSLESRKDPAITEPAFFGDEYKAVNVNIGHLDKNIDLAKSYGAQLKAEALPALTVLDAAGTVVANTNASTLRPEKDPAGIDPAKLAAFLKSHQAPAPNATAIFETALNQAKNEDKMVFAWFSAPWCVWCHRLGEWMATKDVAAVAAKEFVIIKIDGDRATGAKDLAMRLIGKNSSSLPWFAFLDADGKCLINSIRPDGGNIGHPGTSDEVAYFKSMLQKVKKHLTDDEISFLIQSFEAFNKTEGIQPANTH